MSDTLKEGLSATRRIDIDAARSISFMGEECRVYATPSLLRDVESTCRDLIKEHIDAGKDSVGTRVELDHIGATLIGMWVEITVTLNKVDGPTVCCDFTVRDAVEQVARGKHNRFVVGIERTAQRLMAKRAGSPRRSGAGPRLGGQFLELRLQLVLALGVGRIDDDAIDRAHLDALRLVEVSDALGALVRIDDEDLSSGGDGVVRALGFAHGAVDAVFRDYQSHFLFPQRLDG